MDETEAKPEAMAGDLSTSRKRRQVLWIVAALLCLGFGLFNLVAWNQARAMMTFVPARQGEHGLRREQSLSKLIFGVTAYRPENLETPEKSGLAYTTHRTQARDGSGIEMWECAHPEPRAVAILFHGYAASKSSMIPDAQALHDMGCTAYLVDFRGSGGSDGNATTVGYHEGMDVAAAYAFVRERHPDARIVLLGRSMGAAAVLRAIHAEKVAPDAIILESVFDRMLTTVANRFRVMGLPTFPAAQTLLFWGSVHAGFWAFDHNPEEYALSVKCPALVIQGEQDTRARPEDARRVFENLPEGSRWQIFKEAEHIPLLQHDDYLWRESVGELLAHLGREK